MSAVIEKRRLSHSLTRLIGALAALVLLAVSAAMNYLFLSALGKTPVESQVLGAASASADLLKAVLPFLIVWAWRAGRYSVALPGLLVWIVFCVFSLLSAIGFAAGNRESITDARVSMVQRYEMVRSNLKAAEEERERLPKHRAVEIVAAAIDAHKQHRRWASTDSCKDATVPDSRSYCRDYFALGAELAAAQKGAGLAAKIEGLHAQAQGLREAGGDREPEPQVGLLARLFGLERDPVRLVLILLIAGLVELGAGLGLYLSMSGGSPARASLQLGSSRHSGRTGQTRRSAKYRQPLGAVEDFAWACLEPAQGLRMSEAELLTAYRLWCADNGRRPIEAENFVAGFVSLAEEIGVETNETGFKNLRLK